MANNLEKKAKRRQFTPMSLTGQLEGGGAIATSFTRATSSILKKPKPVKVPPPSEPKKPSRIIMGEISSKGPFVREQVIELSPSAGERGIGEGSKAGAGATIGSRTTQQRRRSSSGVRQMGGRHTSSTRR